MLYINMLEMIQNESFLKKCGSVIQRHFTSSWWYSRPTIICRSINYQDSHKDLEMKFHDFFMTIFQEFHDFVNEYKNVHHHSGLN